MLITIVVFVYVKLLKIDKYMVICFVFMKIITLIKMLRLEGGRGVIYVKKLNLFVGLFAVTQYIYLNRMDVLTFDYAADHLSVENNKDYTFLILDETHSDNQNSRTSHRIGSNLAKFDTYVICNETKRPVCCVHCTVHKPQNHPRKTFIE